jgi:exodeoxyribonuclease III
MRIVVWNCAMRLRGAKLKALEDLGPDIAIVPECESPEKLWGKQPLLAPIPMEWIGDNEHKGLGVLAFNGYHLKRHANYDASLRWVLPVEVQGPVKFRLLAVGATKHRIPSTEGEDLAGQPLQVADSYRDFLAAGPSVVAGDFNNNVRWDKGKRATNHAYVVAALERLGLSSAFHVGRGERHGKESVATLYGRDRKQDGPQYHVDYCFMPLEWCSRLADVTVGEFDGWIATGLSNHVPLVVDVEVPGLKSRKPSTRMKAVRTDLR